MTSDFRLHIVVNHLPDKTWLLRDKISHNHIKSSFLDHGDLALGDDVLDEVVLGIRAELHQIPFVRNPPDRR